MNSFQFQSLNNFRGKKSIHEVRNCHMAQWWAGVHSHQSCHWTIVFQLKAEQIKKMTTGSAIIEVSKNENHLRLQSRSYLVLHLLQFCFLFFLLRYAIRCFYEKIVLVYRVEEELSTQPTIILFFCRLFWSRADFLGCYRFVPATSLSFCHGVLPWPCPRPGSVWCREPQTSLLPFTAWISKSPPSIPSKLHWWD